MNPQELKSIISSGLLSFPLTDFDDNGDFRPKTYRERLEWLVPYGATALFAAGGTGEFFSLTGDEYPSIIKTAVDTCRGKVAIIAGTGGPTRFALACAKEAERLGADGILLLPHYLTEASQEGLIHHVQAVCNSVKFGVIVYNRNVCKLTPDSLAILAERCPNLIGFKDGVGEIETMMSIYLRMGDLPKCMPPRTKPLVRRCIPPRCSTSFRRRRWTSTRRWRAMTSRHNIDC